MNQECTLSMELLASGLKGIPQPPKPSLSWIDKVLLWNPCNPWTPIPKCGATNEFIYGLGMGIAVLAYNW